MFNSCSLKYIKLKYSKQSSTFAEQAAIHFLKIYTQNSAIFSLYSQNYSVRHVDLKTTIFFFNSFGFFETTSLQAILTYIDRGTNSMRVKLGEEIVAYEKATKEAFVMGYFLNNREHMYDHL